MKQPKGDRGAGASAARRAFGNGYIIRFTGALDRHEAEALQVEIRALAKRYRLVIDDISVRRVTAGGSA